MKTLIALAALMPLLAACGPSTSAPAYGYAPGYHHSGPLDPAHCKPRGFPACSGESAGQ